MDDTVSVKITGDASDLLNAMRTAVQAVNNAGDAIAREYERIGDAARKATAGSGEASEKRNADRIVQIHKQTVDKLIQGEEQLNRYRLQSGEETLQQFAANEAALAQRKYGADLKALNDELAKKKITLEDFAAQKALLDLEYENKKAQIARDSETKQRQLEQQSRQEFIDGQQAKLRAGTAAIDAQYRTRQIDAQQREQLEAALTAATRKQIDARLAFDLEAMNADSAAYRKLEKQKEKIDEQFAQRHRQVMEQSLNQEQQKWQGFSNAIASSFGNAIKGMIFQHMTWQRAVGTVIEGVADQFLRMGEKILADWIENLIMQEVVTKTTTSETSLGQISAAAGVAGANMTASWAAAPWPLDTAAPAMGEAAAAQALSFGSMLAFDVGAWNLPADMPALLHKGEMVVPQNFASGLRANGGVGGGDTVFNNHYYPTINMREPNDIGRLLGASGAEFAAAIQRGYRAGLPVRPSMRTV